MSTKRRGNEKNVAEHLHLPVLVLSVPFEFRDYDENVMTCDMLLRKSCWSIDSGHETWRAAASTETSNR